ncbi:MAG TPA: TolC family protein [Candidatus Cybelea sp.]|nr:TolC family protein [Candidatus Cybelea sp.]
MKTFGWLSCALFLLTCASADAQTGAPLTWGEVRQRFAQNNPTLLAGQLNVSESKAEEITAYLRPNPNLTLLADQIDPFPGGPTHGPFAYLLPSATLTYLHERDHKRELRLESAQEGTAIATSSQADLERGLLFNLRSAFVGTLEAKAVLKVAQDNLNYWDHLLSISRDRYQAGDLAEIDFDRLELQRVQYESDVETAEVNLRTAKIQLLLLLNERTPVDQFDVVGPFEYTDQLQGLDELRKLAFDNRPDLRAARQSVLQATTNHKLAVANGSTDPTFSFDVGRNPPIDQYIGVDVSIPLRIFDRNQGEKLRTQLDIGRNERLLDAAQAQVLGDVDSAYAMVKGNLILLRPYKAKYLGEAVHVRETIRFSYEHGGASLLDLLNAESDYRGVQLSYVNLIGAYLAAAAQLNMAVGEEVIP